MASTNIVIFPESIADIIANPVDICFGSSRLPRHREQCSHLQPTDRDRSIDGNPPTHS
jgi:hypothetical protein